MGYVIRDHLLQGVGGSSCDLVRTPNMGDALASRYLVIHYTAGRGAESTVRRFCDPAAQVSAHVVISRTGEVTQLVPFNRQAWHAGESTWVDRGQRFDGLNKHSVGIELDNPGRLERQGGQWRSWFGVAYPDGEVLEAAHRHEPGRTSGWTLYTPEQLDSLVEVAAALVPTYKLQAILGHDDIAPRQKSDPGPAFPMDSFRARIFGRKDDEVATYVTRAPLNIRVGPGAHHEKVRPAPLPVNTKLEVLSERGVWREVMVSDELDGAVALHGWVHGQYIAPAHPVG
jgi:N-acetylmuramoyl-L-alanine amidase